MFVITGLITIFDLNNYGNRLQNYALSTVLSRYVGSIITIPDLEQPYAGKPLKMIKHVLGLILHLVGFLGNRRYNSFTRFTLHYIQTNTFLLPTSINAGCYVVGSDQVWNPFFKHLSDYDTLEFAQGSICKGIAYAASFGIDVLPEEFLPRLNQIANNFDFISVREESGKTLFEKYTNRKDVQVLVDPTMLLTPSEWNRVSHKPKRFGQERFILMYFLGNVSDERRGIINEFAVQHGYSVIELMDKESEYYSYGPSEFIWCISHAECVLTDSYHGSIISFLYDKPFFVYDREDDTKDMSTRLDTLLGKFGLEDRKYKGVLSDELMDHDYSEAYKILENERKKSHEFLSKALSD